VAETAANLMAEGEMTPTFVSPNVKRVEKGHMQKVYQAFTEFYYSRPVKQ
jgi:hypothetical protein